MRTAIQRQIPRREVLAFIALNCDEAMAPQEVEFREYAYSGRDWHVVELTVETEAAVRHWAKVFGHGERDFRRSEHVREDGTRWTRYGSQSDDWRGFITQVSASIDDQAVTASVLDEDTSSALREIAGGAR